MAKPQTKANRWNRIIYTLWAPFYDLLIDAPMLARARRHGFEKLALQEDERVCLVGVGTGADFPLLPRKAGIQAVGIDLSEAMLAKARRKLPLTGVEITLDQGNAEALPYSDGSFDAAVLTLILSVAADGAACLREARRITRPGGRLLVFDKFLPPGGNGCASWGRRLLNLLTRVFGTDINRSFEAMIEGLSDLRVVSDDPVLFGGAYRTILLEKKSS